MAPLSSAVCVTPDPWMTLLWPLCISGSYLQSDWCTGRQPLRPHAFGLQTQTWNWQRLTWGMVTTPMLGHSPLLTKGWYWSNRWVYREKLVILVILCLMSITLTTHFFSFQAIYNSAHSYKQRGPSEQPDSWDRWRLSVSQTSSWQRRRWITGISKDLYII